MNKTTRLVLSTALIALGANVISADQADASTSSNDDTVDGMDSEDEIFLFFLFSFFALCVSFFSSFLLYLSYVDDRIMKRYSEEGTLIEGEVVMTEFTTGANDKTKVDFSGQKEYFVSIEYSLLLSEFHPIRIRKQLRVLECDFCQPDRQPTSHDPKPNPVVEIIASRDSFFRSFHFDHGRKLELLVLPDHHLSALPACHVKRRLSTKYRLYSITVVLVATVIAVFCFHLAAQQWQGIYGEDGNRQQTTGKSFLIGLLFAVLALSPVPCIHWLLHEMILYALQGEYFERGGSIIKGFPDDSSLSSRSDFGRSSSYFGYNPTLQTQSTLG